jgi:hypothetical protein
MTKLTAPYCVSFIVFFFDTIPADSLLLLLLLLLLLYTARQTNPITGQETLRHSAIT